MKTPPKVHGLHLWFINECYWITTYKRDMDKAIAKTRLFFAKQGIDSEISDIEYHGTLDA